MLFLVRYLLTLKGPEREDSREDRLHHFDARSSHRELLEAAKAGGTVCSERTGERSDALLDAPLPSPVRSCVFLCLSFFTIFVVDLKIMRFLCRFFILY